jgi:16S rRNA processing protein RimM
VNREVFIEREAFPEPEKGEHYRVDLLGMDVESDQGNRLGKLQEIFSTGANDVFVIQGRKREIFLPATDEVIKKIDREKGVIEVHWMEGLWEEEDEV